MLSIAVYQYHTDFISISNSSCAFNLIVASQLFSSYCTYIDLWSWSYRKYSKYSCFYKSQDFCHNLCALYLIVESVIDIIQLTHMFINEIWELSIDESEPVNVSFVWRKLRIIVGQWWRFTLASIVCFLAIDQFLTSNHVTYLRQLSSLKFARCVICIATLLCLLRTVAFGIFLEIRPPSGCIITRTAVVNCYSSFYYLILNGLFRIIVSSMFSVFAYRNVRRIVRRQISIDYRRLDQQLTGMIFGSSNRLCGFIITLYDISNLPVYC